jgi:hypothetical protein
VSLGPCTDAVVSLLGASELYGNPSMREYEFVASKLFLRRLTLEHQAGRPEFQCSWNDEGGTILGRPVVVGSDLETVRLRRQKHRAKVREEA